DEHAQTAELRGGAQRALPLVLAAHVEVHEDRGVADVLGDLLALLVEDVGDDDLRALAREEPRLGLPLAACASGDDGDLAVQPTHSVLLLGPGPGSAALMAS